MSSSHDKGARDYFAKTRGREEGMCPLSHSPTHCIYDELASGPLLIFWPVTPQAFLVVHIQGVRTTNFSSGAAVC